MTRNLLVSAVVPACIVFQSAALPIPASGQGLFGGVGGVTRDSASKQPLALVRITARNVSKGTERIAISGLDGTFIMPGLEPGLYDMAAARDGFAKSIAHVEVAAPGTHRVDFLLAADYPPVREAKTSPVAADATVTAVEEELAALKQRIAQLETALHARSAPAGTTSAAPTDSAVPAASATAVAAPVPAAAPQQPAAPAPAAPSFPEALQNPDPSPTPDNDTPFAFADFSWLNGNARNNPVLDTKFFTPEIRFDTHFMTDFNQPIDHSMGGATESFRSGEFQEEQISVGGDFHWKNVRGRILTMFGLFATTTPRNDASTAVGQWDTGNAYRYVSEAWGGYHFNVNHGLNVDAGIFVSYIGLFSYYNFDNWTYQPSFVSSNTPWFFNGLRIQWFPTNKLKIEPWIINGWQSYNRMNGHHGFGGQILYRPKEWLSLVFNNYGNGTDTLGVPNRVRIHTDDSIEVRYFNKPDSTSLSKMAFSVTADAGCEYGKLGGTSCTGKGGQPKQAFLGWMAYDRMWFQKDRGALTLGGGQMNNPGRYLTLLPPINGAVASSGSPYFTQNPGDKAHMWDATLNLQYMPKQWITWWFEGGYRHSDVPYWSGRGGITPPGGNNGSPNQFACMSGAPSGTNDLPTAYANCGGPGSVWFPDLRHGQAAISVGVLVKF
jgi:Putative beta-barrel porin-2, OmpL-like. bbp2/Carboxypeptidase regulatory-like domain